MSHTMKSMSWISTHYTGNTIQKELFRIQDWCQKLVWPPPIFNVNPSSNQSRAFSTKFQLVDLLLIVCAMNIHPSFKYFIDNINTQFYFFLLTKNFCHFHYHSCIYIKKKKITDKTTTYIEYLKSVLTLQPH